MTQLAVRQRSQGTGASGYGPQFGATSSESPQPGAVVHLVAAAEVGSGGVAGIDWSRAHARTGPFTIVREAGTEDAFTTADRVLLLRRWLSLSIAEAARALHVQRPTIYAWQDGKAPAVPKNLERLRIVFDLARDWRAISSEPVGNHRKEPLGPRGRTLVDLLSADEIARERVLETLNRIADAMTRQRARRPSSAAELAARFGFQPIRDREFDGNVARESARRSRKNGDP